MIRFGLFAATLMSGALLVGCSGDCSSASDCARDQVCYKQVCTAAASESLLCNSDEDCQGEGASDLFECRGGLCRLVSIGGNTGSSDASVADTGLVDTGVPDSGTSTVTDAGN